MEKVFRRTMLQPFSFHSPYFPISPFPLISVVFAESLDNIQTLVESKFCDIKNVGRKPFSFPGPPCSSKDLQVYICLQRIYNSNAPLDEVTYFEVCTHICLIVYNLQILVKAVPIKQGHTLRILWPITPNVRHYKEGP